MTQRFNQFVHNWKGRLDVTASNLDTLITMIVMKMMAMATTIATTTTMMMLIIVSMIVRWTWRRLWLNTTWYFMYLQSSSWSTVLHCYQIQRLWWRSILRSGHQFLGFWLLLWRPGIVSTVHVFKIRHICFWHKFRYTSA